jgi:PEP-CTERM motif
MSNTFRVRAAITMFLLAALVLTSGAAQASTIDWTGLDPAWDDTDTSGQQSFSNVDGSGIDITVAYTDNMFDNNSVPNLYTTENAPTAGIAGTLRFTNDRRDRASVMATAVTISFSEAVYIDEMGTVSLSTIHNKQENMIVEAFDANGAAVFATTYGTNTAGLVDLDTDGDAAYRSRGLGAQADGLYGDTFYSYTDIAIKTLRFTIVVTRIGEDEIKRGFSSQGIEDIGFSAVPEPSTAILLGLGLLTLGRRAGRRE